MKTTVYPTRQSVPNISFCEDNMGRTEKNGSTSMAAEANNQESFGGSVNFSCWSVFWIVFSTSEGPFLCCFWFWDQETCQFSYLEREAPTSRPVSVALVKFFFSRRRSDFFWDSTRTGNGQQPQPDSDSDLTCFICTKMILWQMIVVGQIICYVVLKWTRSEQPITSIALLGSIGQHTQPPATSRAFV